MPDPQRFDILADNEQGAGEPASCHSAHRDTQGREKNSVAYFSE
jgi:hypothetical protein